MKDVQMGMKNIVILADFKAIKDAFASDDFFGRPPDIPFELRESTMKSGAFLGMAWKEQRRFAIFQLRELGLGKTRMEDHLKEEILELLERLDSYLDKTVQMSEVLNPSMSNNIASLLFGRRLKYSDPKRQELDRLLNDVGRYAGGTVWQLFFPALQRFMKYFHIGNQGKLHYALEGVLDYVRKEVQHHEDTLDPNNIRDFIDGYLLEIKKKSNDPKTTFNRDVLMDVSRAFFGAGSETVRVTLDWMVLVCAGFPNVQEKIRTEVTDVIGERFPIGMDRNNMPYTEAAICELMRWRPIVPLNIMRYTIKDTELNGYFIPKHSDVLAVLWAVSYDETLWGQDTDVFRPERFLTEDGQTVVKPEHFIPFSIGKRQCPGKRLAEDEVFLYLVAILQKYEISLPPGKKADFEGVLGLSLQPKRQDICLKLRK